ncbi:maleylpyruvate isomerase N-terminal domain-containing protein [Nocardioides cynanchi]|uniref:maleylpyruvate isomerase N-terminal domain-containing protein n=1 Tax=Nocardioides cynanchi TaxID=2558918 RepID=UPI0012446434|nr:maleylpyruvate isomerase N-terminal domain-containing protein [Nocardioides cynanchi]
MEQIDSDAFLAAARVAGHLARRAEVTEHWDDESACEAMSVGGLACHLVSQVDNAVRLLGAGPSDQPPIALADHYAGVGWRDPDDEANVGIREGSDARAAAGPQALHTLIDRRLAELPTTLASVGSGDPVLIPWQGWSLTAGDFLVTRMMEIVVHSDDLAASVDLPTPGFPDRVLEPVLGLLTGLAVRRHGATAVVRVLTRPQRAPASIAAF